MPKKKKQPLAWRATKGAFRGAWFLTKGTFKLMGKAIKATDKKILEGSKQRQLKRSVTYNKRPAFDALEVVESISGDYAVSEKRLHKDSMIALIFGKRGSGKSALGFKILENIHSKTSRKCFVLGVEQASMPKWINPIDKVEEAPRGSVVLVDEGAIAFSSRASMSKSNRGLTSILAIARHKNLTILFITQNTGMIDRNVLKLSDILLVKQGSLLQLEMERPEIKKFYEKAESLFKDLEGDRRQYAYIIDSDFEGAVSHTLPSFWTESLSKNQAEE